MFKKSLVGLAVVAAFFAGAANAGTIESNNGAGSFFLGAHDGVESDVINITVPGAFSHRIFFSVPGVPSFNNIAGLFGTLDFSTADISNASVNLYAGGGVSGTFGTLITGIGTFDNVFGQTNGVNFDIGGLTGGDYYFGVTGNAVGSGSPVNGNHNSVFPVYGTYLFNSQLTLSNVTVPVPEASTYSMMLAGLTAMGFMARRRRNIK